MNEILTTEEKAQSIARNLLYLHLEKKENRKLLISEIQKKIEEHIEYQEFRLIYEPELVNPIKIKEKLDWLRKIITALKN